MTAALQYFAVIFLLLPYIADTWRSFYFDLSSVRAEVHDNRTVQQLHVELLPFRQHKVINVSLIFARRLEAFDIELVVVMPRFTLLDTLFNISMDGCRTLESAYSAEGNLVKIVANAFRKTSGFFPEHCPIPEHRLITIENFYLDAEQFPRYMPEMDFMAQFRVSSNRKYLFKTYINGSVVNKRQKKQNKTRKSGA